MREEELAQKHNRRVPFRCGVRMAGTRRNQVELMLSRRSLRVNINLLFSIPYGRFLTTNGLCLTMIPVTFICDSAHVGFRLRIKRTPHPSPPHEIANILALAAPRRALLCTRAFSTLPLAEAKAPASLQCASPEKSRQSAPTRNAANKSSRS